MIVFRFAICLSYLQPIYAFPTCPFLRCAWYGNWPRSLGSSMCAAVASYGRCRCATSHAFSAGDSSRAPISTRDRRRWFLALDTAIMVPAMKIFSEFSMKWCGDHLNLRCSSMSFEAFQLIFDQLACILCYIGCSPSNATFCKEISLPLPSIRTNDPRRSRFCSIARVISVAFLPKSKPKWPENCVVSDEFVEVNVLSHCLEKWFSTQLLLSHLISSGGGAGLHKMAHALSSITVVFERLKWTKCVGLELACQ